MKQLGDPQSLKRDKHSKLNNATCLLANEKNIKHKHTKKKRAATATLCTSLLWMFRKLKTTIFASEAGLYQSGLVKSNMATATATATATSRRRSPEKPAFFRIKLSVPTSPHLSQNGRREGFLVKDFAINGVKF